MRLSYQISRAVASDNLECSSILVFDLAGN